MTRLFAFALLILLFGQGIVLAERPPRPFKISFEQDGKKVATRLRLRLNHQGKIIEINYRPGKPVHFPTLEPREEFDLWIISEKYTLPFLKKPGTMLGAAGGRVGIDARPFDLKEYLELTLLPAKVKLVYYIMYVHPDGPETPIWFESSKLLEDFRNQTAP